MRVHRAMLALTLLCCASASILAQDKRAMTVDDLLELVRIGDVAMMPDGSQVFYSERHLNWETNEYEKSFFMIPSEGGSPIPFVRKDGGENFFISPDGKYLSMSRKVEEKPQIFVVPLDGGEARPLTEHRGEITDSLR